MKGCHRMVEERHRRKIQIILYLINGNLYCIFLLSASFSRILAKQQQKQSEPTVEASKCKEDEVKAIIEENEGLRQGLQEMLDFLKDNSE